MDGTLAQYSFCFHSFISIIPAVAFSLAQLGYCINWINIILITYKRNSKEYLQLFQRRSKIVYLGFCILFPLLSFTMAGLSCYYKTQSQVFIFQFAEQLLIFLCFLFTGPLLLYRLKKYSSKIYLDSKNKILIAYVLTCLALALSYCFMGYKITSIQHYKEWKKDQLVTNSYDWPLTLAFYVLICEDLPMISFLIAIILSQRKAYKKQSTYEEIEKQTYITISPSENRETSVAFLQDQLDDQLFTYQSQPVSKVPTPSGQTDTNIFKYIQIDEVDQLSQQQKKSTKYIEFLSPKDIGFVPSLQNSENDSQKIKDTQQLMFWNQ